MEKIYVPFEGDENFAMWTLLPAALCFSEYGMSKNVTFEEAATRRRDGAHNIFTGSVENLSVKTKKWDWNGPNWGSNDRIMVWMMNSEFTKARVGYWGCTRNDENLLLTEKAVNGEELSENDFAHLAEQGLLRMENGKPKPAAVHIKGKIVYDELMHIADECKRRVMKELDAVRAEYRDRVLADTPEHLRKMREFGLQYAGCYADGRLVMESLTELLSCGKLKEVGEEQSRHLCILVHSK